MNTWKPEKDPAPGRKKVIEAGLARLAEGEPFGEPATSTLAQGLRSLPAADRTAFMGLTLFDFARGHRPRERCSVLVKLYEQLRRIGWARPGRRAS